MTTNRGKPQGGCLAALLGLALIPGALAHEFWIAPTDPNPEVGASVPLRLFVGDGFEHGEPYPRNPRHLRLFHAWQAERQFPVPGVAGSDPAGVVRFDEPGLAIVGYASGHTTITLEAAAFEAYLAEEGLEHVARRRAAAGASAKPGREAFRRCAKALLVVGGGRDIGGFERRVGLDLELVPERNPFAIPADGRLPVVLLYRGAPLAGAKVKVFRAGHPGQGSSGRTDAQGRVGLALPGHGLVMIAAVHMVPAGAGLEADWESIWASLTFVVPPPAAGDAGMR